MYLDELRGAKASDPQEAALSRGNPHPRDEVEDIRLDYGILELKHLVVMKQALVNINPQLILRQVFLHCRLQLACQVVVLLLPPTILHVEHRCI